MQQTLAFSFVGPQDDHRDEVTCGELIYIQCFLNNMENEIHLGLATSGDLLYQLSSYQSSHINPIASWCYCISDTDSRMSLVYIRLYSGLTTLNFNGSHLKIVSTYVMPLIYCYHCAHVSDLTLFRPRGPSGTTPKVFFHNF